MKIKFAWNKKLTEAVTIICSILIAFSIDAWWERRTKSINLEAAIKNVAAEVKQDRSEIERAVGRNKARIKGLKLFLSLSEGELKKLSDEDAVKIGESFDAPSPFDPGAIALESLLQVGGLELVSSNKLGGALLIWAQFPNEIELDHEETLALTLAVYQRSAKYGLHLGLLAHHKKIAIPDAPSVQVALAAMRTDTEVAGSVAQLILFFEDFSRQLERGVAKANAVIEASKRQ